MKFEKINGIYWATKQHRNGTICTAAATVWADAATYCFESLADEDRKENAKKCILRIVK